MAQGWKSLASLRVAVQQTRQHQCRRKPQITSKKTKRNKKPTAACHSWFFLYWAKEKEPAESPGSLAAVRRGKKSGTARAYSSKDAPGRTRSSLASRRITME